MFETLVSSFNRLSINEKYRLLGRAVAQSGVNPSNGIQQIINKDHQKQEAFGKGLIEGVLLDLNKQNKNNS